MFHFTDKSGFDAIRSQPMWRFLAQQPRRLENPKGAYFTSYPPGTWKLSVKIFVPKAKLEYVFQFEDRGDLLPLPGGRGHNNTIYYSPVDYCVERERQLFHSASDDWDGGE